MHYLFLLKRKRNMKKKRKGKFQKTSRKIVFLGGCEEFVFCKTGIFEKWTKTICVRKVKKNAHFRCNYLFLESGIFVTIQNHQTLQKGVSAGRGENPKWHFWFQKCHLGFSPRKGVSLSVIHRSCVLLKTLFYDVFSTTQPCRNNRV